MDCIVHGAAKSQTRLSNFHFTSYYYHGRHPQKVTNKHLLGFCCGSVVKNLAVMQEIICNAGDCEFDPWVGKIPWRRKWQSTPVLLPGKSHGQRSLVRYSLGGT